MELICVKNRKVGIFYIFGPFDTLIAMCFRVSQYRLRIDRKVKRVNSNCFVFTFCWHTRHFFVNFWWGLRAKIVEVKRATLPRFIDAKDEIRSTEPMGLGENQQNNSRKASFDSLIAALMLNFGNFFFRNWLKRYLSHAFVVYSQTLGNGW